VRLLLDTHVWIWAMLEPSQLSKKASAALTAPEHELHLSPISTWEALVLAERGHLKVHGSIEAWVRSALRALPGTIAPITHEIAILSRNVVGLGTKDPADRFLAATSIVHDLTLVTADGPLRRCKAVPTLW